MPEFYNKRFGVTYSKPYGVMGSVFIASNRQYVNRRPVTPLGSYYSGCSYFGNASALSVTGHALKGRALLDWCKQPSKPLPKKKIHQETPKHMAASVTPESVPDSETASSSSEEVPRPSVTLPKINTKKNEGDKVIAAREHLQQQQINQPVETKAPSPIAQQGRKGVHRLIKAELQQLQRKPQPPKTAKPKHRKNALSIRVHCGALVWGRGCKRPDTPKPQQGNDVSADIYQLKQQMMWRRLKAFHARQGSELQFGSFDESASDSTISPSQVGVTMGRKYSLG